MTARLITIPFSHYCEKGRWSLERCGVDYVEDGHLPMLHYLATRRATGTRTVPVVIAGTTVLTDSTDIAQWADAKRPGTLLPTDEQHRSEALALEDEFDRQLGPATRRWAYFQLLPLREGDRYIAADIPRWQATVFRFGRPLFVRMMARGLRIDAAGAARSQAKIDAQFAAVSERVRDGRRYLVGDAFSIADLTFAALAVPVLLPPQFPIALPPLELLPAAGRAQIEAWRATPAGRFALRIYAEER